MGEVQDQPLLRTVQHLRSNHGLRRVSADGGFDLFPPVKVSSDWEPGMVLFPPARVTMAAAPFTPVLTSTTSTTSPPATTSSATATIGLDAEGLKLWHATLLTVGSFCLLVPIGLALVCFTIKFLRRLQGDQERSGDENEWAPFNRSIVLGPALGEPRPVDESHFEHKREKVCDDDEAVPRRELSPVPESSCASKQGFEKLEGKSEPTASSSSSIPPSVVVAAVAAPRENRLPLCPETTSLSLPAEILEHRTTQPPPILETKRKQSCKLHVEVPWAKYYAAHVLPSIEVAGWQALSLEHFRGAHRAAAADRLRSALEGESAAQLEAALGRAKAMGVSNDEVWFATVCHRRLLAIEEVVGILQAQEQASELSSSHVRKALLTRKMSVLHAMTARARNEPALVLQELHGLVDGVLRPDSSVI